MFPVCYLHTEVIQAGVMELDIETIQGIRLWL